MKRLLAGILAVATVGCAPSYVWGGEHRVRQQLLEMVPPGSSFAALANVAAIQGWKIDRRNIRTWPMGARTYMESRNVRKCRSYGGPVVPAMIAHYSSPLDTYVESLWLFDTQQRVADVCVRKDFDGP